ncbi:hypothetical protein KO566_12870 [Flavobacteriaceae bacterium XHP0103]|uniref:hypothetical protein n=1 Tax=Marixanthotalea marina TaxID=2844359 RepID=UPI002989EFD5|nr:hypothetical protein [Marixanthotalea marina]MBU3822956.1 hypothetical protein [Marixanthotalea marina]
MTVDKEDEYKIEKSFKKNKMAGIETYHKKRKESMMSFMYDDRFAIVVSSKQLDRDTVWKAIELLNLENLN